MRAYFDFEFCGFDDLTPISLGVCCTKHSFYAEFPYSVVSEWARDNVLPKLAGISRPAKEIAESLKAYLCACGITELICDTSYDERIMRGLGIKTKIVRAKINGWDKPHDHHALRDAVALMELNSERADSRNRT